MSPESSPNFTIITIIIKAILLWTKPIKLMLVLCAVSVQLYVFFFSCPITYPHKYFTLAVVAVFTESAVANVDISPTDHADV